MSEKQKELFQKNSCFRFLFFPVSVVELKTPQEEGEFLCFCFGLGFGFFLAFFWSFLLYER